MCGIVGVVNRDGRKVNGDLLQAMTDMLQHRERETFDVVHADIIGLIQFLEPRRDAVA